MSQYLSQTLGQHLRMEQRLTPQLIQSMAILQKPLAELEAYIEEALESNPALELAEPEARDTDNEQKRMSQDRNGADPGEGFSRLDRFVRDTGLELGDDGRLGPRRAAPPAGERDAKMEAMANTVGREKNLNEVLLDQWSLAEVSDEIRRAGEVIINKLDPDGYLRVRLDELAGSVRPPISAEVMEDALWEVQDLDPPGVGARDIVECFTLQLDALPGDNRIERRIVDHHLDDLMNNRLPAIARHTGYSLGEITEAVKVLRSTLHLHPGYLVGDRSVPAIRPDVIVEYAATGGGYTVRLARGNLPALRVADRMVDLARTREGDPATREFARKHVDEASALIDAVGFRRGRLLEVAHAIVQKQRAFFDEGPQRLGVLRMSDLAEELGCDPSTISRTVAEKYLQTPRGFYPLRYFFTGGTDTGDGKSASWDSVKNRVRELVAGEDTKTPYSDDQIVELLAREGIELSRRTVAKYRSQLDIPAARQRKQF